MVQEKTIVGALLILAAMGLFILAVLGPDLLVRFVTGVIGVFLIIYGAAHFVHPPSHR